MQPRYGGVAKQQGHCQHRTRYEDGVDLASGTSRLEWLEERMVTEGQGQEDDGQRREAGNTMMYQEILVDEGGGPTRQAVEEAPGRS